MHLPLKIRICTCAEQPKQLTGRLLKFAREKQKKKGYKKIWKHVKQEVEKNLITEAWYTKPNYYSANLFSCFFQFISS